MCIGFRKATEAKVVRMGGYLVFPTGNKVFVYHVDVGVKYECVGRKKGVSKAGIKGEGLVSFIHSYTGFRVFANAIFEEVRFPLEADHFHPFERVAYFDVSLVPKGNQESVGAKLDVVAHHG